MGSKPACRRLREMYAGNTLGCKVPKRHCMTFADVFSAEFASETVVKLPQPVTTDRQSSSFEFPESVDDTLSCRCRRRKRSPTVECKPGMSVPRTNLLAMSSLCPPSRNGLAKRTQTWPATLAAAVATRGDRPRGRELSDGQETGDDSPFLSWSRPPELHRLLCVCDGFGVG